jgi:ubiquinone/menaquinone biosynthesis C-methylase UbiE
MEASQVITSTLQRNDMPPATKGYKGLGMEGFIAKWYAKSTAKAMNEFAADARRVAALLPLNAEVLEVAPGPGYFAVELGKLGNYGITGLDVSKTFVDIARRNAAEAGVNAHFQVGNASNMPFESGRFDFLFCRAAFKNFSEPVRALQEMQRVLKPGGRVLIIDMRGDSTKEEIEECVQRLNLPFFSRVFTRLAFRTMLLKRAYTRSQFEEMLKQTQFSSIEIEEKPMGMDIWLGK